MSIDFFKNWKDYLIVGLILLAVILGITASYYYKKDATPAQIAQSKKIQANPKADIVKSFKDQQGLSHVQIKADQNKIPAATLKDTTAHIKGILDTVKKALDLGSLQQIEELTQEVISLKEQIKLKSVRDSSGRNVLAFNDPWLSVKYSPLDSVLNLHYDAKITATRFFRYPIPFIHFIKSQDYIDFFGDDPRMTINGVKHATFTQPDPLFGFSADAKASYLINSGRLVPSFGADLRVGKFYFEGREYYSIRNDKFLPMVSVGYKYLSF